MPESWFAPVVWMHGAWRLVVVTMLGLMALTMAWGWFRRSSWSWRHRLRMALVIAVLDLQMVLGVLTGLLSPRLAGVRAGRLPDPGGDWTVLVHAVVLLLVIVLAHVLKILAVRTTTDRARFAACAWTTSVVLLAVLACTPW